MRWDRLSLTAFGGIAALAIGGAMLLAEAARRLRAVCSA